MGIIIIFCPFSDISLEICDILLDGMQQSVSLTNEPCKDVCFGAI